MSLPEDKENVEDKIAELYGIEKLNDVSLKIINGTDIETFKSNRFALSLSSPYFLAVFNSENWIESHGELIIEDISPKTFEKFLKFIYYKPIDFSSVKDATALYTVADRFLVPRLQKFVLSKLENDIKPADACFLYSFAHLYKLNNLLRKCHETIKFQTDKILQCYKELGLEDFLIILEQDFLNVKEINLFVSVLEWIVYRNEIEDAITPEDRNLLKKKIRFLNMNEEEMTVVASTTFLSPEEIRWFSNYDVSLKDQFPSHLSQSLRKVSYQYSLRDGFYKVKEKLTRSAIVLRTDQDIFMNCIDMFTQDGDPSKTYMEDLTFILYPLGSINNIIKIHINERLNHSSIYSIDLNDRALIRKNVDYWMAFIKEEKPIEDSREPNLYYQIKLNGNVFVYKVAIYLNRHILVNYSPKLPVAGFQYSLVNN